MRVYLIYPVRANGIPARGGRAWQQDRFSVFAVDVIDARSTLFTAPSLDGMGAQALLPTQIHTRAGAIEAAMNLQASEWAKMCGTSKADMVADIGAAMRVSAANAFALKMRTETR